MNPYQFLRELAGLPTGVSGTPGGGDGIRREIQLNILSDLRTAAGLVLDGSTTAPQVAAFETHGLGVKVAASTTAAGSFTFDVPKDYDPEKDELTIRIISQTGGSTDAPTFTATAYNKRAGSALSAALTAVTSAAISKAAGNAGEVSIGLSSNGLKPDDILTVNLVTSAHTTDTVNIYSVDMVYRSNIVFSDMGTR